MNVDGHPVQWDHEKVARFWGWHSSHGDYFSQYVAKALGTFLERMPGLSGSVLDFGCGPGFLTSRLLEMGVSCSGFDSSPESVELVNRKFAGDPGWRGARAPVGDRLPYADGEFDLVVCVETIEHVLDQDMRGLLSELRRILNPRSGRLVVTTPNREDLAHGMVYCPDCRGVFHHVQHQRSLDVPSLRQLMEGHGFATMLCRGTDFNEIQKRFVPNPLRWSPGYASIHAYRAALRWFDWMRFPGRPPGGLWLDAMLSDDGPHLVWCGSVAG